LPDRPRLAIVIAAAGRGDRFGSDKMSGQLGDRTVLETAVSALGTAIPTAPVVVVVASERLEGWRAVLEADSPKTVVIAGGERRQDSVRIGVERAAAGWGAEVVAIHDGARPLVSPVDVGRVVDSLGDSDASILAVSATDTVKKADACGVVVETLDRAGLRLAQTPQVCRVAALENAWRRQDLSRHWSDEAALIEADGGVVQVVEAMHPNPKITTGDDLEVVRIMFRGRS
jgi:2-C-methyl-D-erythritol 4-phosphate cytidylyltransferase